MYRTNVVLPIPSNSAHQGCYIDDPNRDLDALIIPAGATVESCYFAAKSQRFAYFGLQDGGQCFAGNAINYARAPDQNDCRTPCNANIGQTCGGNYRNNIYVTGESQPQGFSTSYAYKGCFSDDANHAFDALLIYNGATVETCMAAAGAMGYKYAGLQWYGACSANNAEAYSKDPTDDDCDTPCTANTSETCGGAWHNSVYLSRPY
jgi:hypothetical protein